MTAHHANTAMINEQREYPRYDIQVPAKLRLKNGLQYEGKTNNISNSGAFFEFNASAHPKAKLTKDAHCILTLFVEGKSSSEELKIKCVFKPSRKGGASLEFKTITTDDYINFIFLLGRNYPKPEELFAELKDNPGVHLLSDI